jgi:hypothetical protein
MNSHEADLLDIAAFALKRHGTPEKALAGFTDKIHSSAPLLRAVIGEDVIKAAALAYLKSVPAKAGGGVRKGHEGHLRIGPAESNSVPSQEGGTVHVTDESQPGVGGADSSSVPSKEGVEVLDGAESHCDGGLDDNSGAAESVRVVDAKAGLAPSSPDPNKPIAVIAHKRRERQARRQGDGGDLRCSRSCCQMAGISKSCTAGKSAGLFRTLRATLLCPFRRSAMPVSTTSRLWRT